MSKITKIPSELRNFFTEKRSSSVFEAYSKMVENVSLVIIRYNLLASIKRSMDYDTIGGLFADIYEGVHELTVVEKIWDIIFEVIAVVAEILEADSEKLLTEVINNSKRLEALRLFAQAA